MTVEPQDCSSSHVSCVKVQALCDAPASFSIEFVPVIFSVIFWNHCLLLSPTLPTTCKSCVDGGALDEIPLSKGPLAVTENTHRRSLGASLPTFPWLSFSPLPESTSTPSAIPDFSFSFAISLLSPAIRSDLGAHSTLLALALLCWWSSEF